MLHPEYLNWRKKIKPDLNTIEGREQVLEKMDGAFTTYHLPSLPKTIPDNAVSILLEKFYKLNDVKRILKEHQLAMASENFVGYLLELYIFSVAHNYGWVLCPDSIFKSVDFVKQNPDGTWHMLQIKNRSNSENSSSSKVRVGTTINKWFRSFSHKDISNWENFPDKELNGQLSEEGFHSFIEMYLHKFMNDEFKLS